MKSFVSGLVPLLGKRVGTASLGTVAVVATGAFRVLPRSFSSGSDSSHPTVEQLGATYQRLISGNHDFIKETNDKDPTFFERSSKSQSPHTLWIGCADSRVPANLITGTDAGDLFVHRNISNTVVSTDFNLLSVLQYAVDVLGVHHICVVGHYGCGGIQAALSSADAPGVVRNWLHHIKLEYSKHQEELEAITDNEERLNRMTEIHVQEGVFTLAQSPILKAAWARHCSVPYPQIHGWVYSLKDGLIKDLGVTVKGPEDIPAIITKPVD